MTANIVAEINLHDLPNIAPDLAHGKAMFQIECCVWCMTQVKKTNGSLLKVLEDSIRENYRVVWDDPSIDYEKVRNSVHTDEGIEYGAEAIALILAILRTEYDSVQRSAKGDGDDYRLVKSNSWLFQESAKLEISGILKADSNSRINTRLKEKLEQVSKKGDGLSGCAIVVEFSRFVAKVAWNND